MGEKDYLSELAANAEKPASFKEEKVEFVNKKQPNFKTIGIMAIVIVICAIGVYYFFLAPKITMLDFVGQDKTELNNWIKQEGIETSKIVVNEAYNFDYDEDVIFDQSIPAGSKIKKDVKLTVSVSLGADPDEEIVVPELMDMDASEIADWVKTNKLTNVKTTTLYSDSVAEGEVISLDLSDEELLTFTRNTKLNIVISKGKAPVKDVVLEDFTNQTKAYVASFASKNNIKVEYIEQYSDDVENGLVISQSVAADSAIKENGTLTVTISKGPTVYMPNFIGENEEEVMAWLSANGISNYKFYYRYQNAHNEGKVYYQSIASNQNLTDDDFIYLKVSKGYIDLDDFYDGVYNPDYNAKNFFELQQWVYQQNHDGDAQMPDPVANYVDSSYPKDTILKFNVDDHYLETGSTIYVDVSNGSLATLDATEE